MEILSRAHDNQKPPVEGVFNVSRSPGTAPQWGGRFGHPKPPELAGILGREPGFEREFWPLWGYPADAFRSRRFIRETEQFVRL